MIGVSAQAVLVERGPQRADAAVHHVARRHGVGARLGLGDRGARQQLERLVVVDHAVGAQHAAVAVARVLAQAQVGDHEQLGMGGLDRARGELDHALVVPCAGALLVLVGGQPEQQHAGDAERRRRSPPPRRRRRSRGGRRRASRDRRPPLSAAPNHEHRVDQVVDATARSRARGRAAGRCGGAAGVGSRGTQPPTIGFRPPARRQAKRRSASRAIARRTRGPAPAGARAAPAARRR